MSDIPKFDASGYYIAPTKKEVAESQMKGRCVRHEIPRPEPVTTIVVPRGHTVIIKVQ